MMSKINVIESKYSGHYIYIVSFKEYYYIGETSHHPVVRWGQHFTDESQSLMKNLKEKYGEELPVIGNIKCFSYSCDFISEEQGNKQKLARRAIEAELHYKFCSDGDIHFEEFNIVSNPPTFPVRHKLGFDAEIVANNIFDSYISTGNNLAL
ncbi:hypothetical protein DSL61_10705 [Vibrio cholerae]|uniref:GIY-YIG nuclease family protein n=1 Tax=Vibrio cholerae TaxID=666 RepID=UPI000DE47029|nr:GIY-YIG nuclease family protein [Vibrio cholerae]RBO16449.1 hypothetical protein DSL61_10705 [Vibrio cholerae]